VSGAPPTSRTARYGMYAAGAIGVGYALWHTLHDIYHQSKPAIDLHVYLTGASAILHGQPLYSVVSRDGLPFTYPPFAALLFTPGTALGTGHLVELVVAALSFAALARSCWLLVVHVRGDGPPGAASATWARWALLLGVACLMEPFLATLSYGQVNLVLLWLVLEDGLGLPVSVAADDLRGYLGEAHWLEAELPRSGRVGESLGLAYTSDGGEVLTIEATIARGRGELVLTGQLGEVMQESGSAAWGYLLSHVERDAALRRVIERSSFLTPEGLDLATQDVRVHVPEGAVPKDGPSAGLALAVAMLSALGGAPVKPRVAMTGEITLGGRILRVGGLKEKLLAAGRMGVRTVVLPAGNRATVAELPADLTAKLDLVYVASFEEALPHVFGAQVFTKRASKGHK